VLARVAEACIAGSAVLKPPARVALGAETRVHLPAASCVRAAAVGTPEQGNVELVLADPSGHELEHDTLPGPIALVGTRGPVCVREEGDYRVTARASSGQDVALGVWRGQ
jgi:hypothetical protein